MKKAAELTEVQAELLAMMRRGWTLRVHFVGHSARWTMHHEGCEPFHPDGGACAALAREGLIVRDGTRRWRAK